MKRKTLHLTVGDKTVAWTFRVMQPGDEDFERDEKGTVPLELDGALKETIDLLVKLQRWLGDALAEGSLPSDKMCDLNERLNDLARILGQNLYSVLFTGRPEEGEPLSNLLLKELGELNKEDLLCVQLEFEGAGEEEETWPWEYMHIPFDKNRAFTNEFLLAPHTQLVLNRRIHLKNPVPSLKTPQPVKVLLVCAAPQGLGPVLHEKVLETVEALRGNGAIELVHLIEPSYEKSIDWRPTAKFQNFKDLVVGEQPHIIHFIGHGHLRNGKGELAFVGEDTKPEWRSDFAEVAALSKNLKLVFLQACESDLPDPHTPFSSVARQCAHRNVPAVVAMQSKIDNAVASTFVCSFYEALAKEKSLDYAVLEGRRAISDMLKKPAAAFGVPVLYLRSYEKLIGPKPVAGISLSEGRCTCPRCKRAIARADPRACPYCGLSFFCVNKDCGHKLVDPVDGVYCDECLTPIDQTLYQPPSTMPGSLSAGTAPPAPTGEPAGMKLINVLGGAIEN